MSQNQKKLVPEALFWFQVVCAIIFGATQFIRMLTTTQGVSASMVLFNNLFVLIGLYLAIMAQRATDSRIARQSVIIYALGVAIYTSWLALVFSKEKAVWDRNDNVTMLVVFIGIVALSVWARQNKLTWKDSVVRGWISLIFKTCPQTIMAWKIYQVGGAGLSAYMIILFHVLTLSRISQLWFLIREAREEKNRCALFLSEVGNEASWCLVTIAWLLMFAT